MRIYQANQRVMISQLIWSWVKNDIPVTNEYDRQHVYTALKITQSVAFLKSPQCVCLLRARDRVLQYDVFLIGRWTHFQLIYAPIQRNWQQVITRSIEVC